MQQAVQSIVLLGEALRVEGDVVFLLSNSFVDRGLSLGQMCKKDVSTKGEGRV